MDVTSPMSAGLLDLAALILGELAGIASSFGIATPCQRDTKTIHDLKTFQFARSI